VNKYWVTQLQETIMIFRVGHRKYNFVWYRQAPEDTVLKDLLTDFDGQFHPHGISPTQVSWKHIAEIRHAARTILAPQFEKF
jgi:hypothetical protein